MKWRKNIHIVRWKDEEWFIGEVGSHEAGHALDNPDCCLRMYISSDCKLTVRLLRI